MLNILFVCFFCSIFILSLTNGLIVDPDEKRSFEELIVDRGFSLQTYSVLTEDGYLIGLYRVVTKDYVAQSYNDRRKPVILYHGVLGSGNNFFINSPLLEPVDENTTCPDDLGFCLVKSGRYDVWSVNARGTRPSQGHVTLETSQKEYWQFSFEQMAKYDLPAIIEFVLGATNRTSVGYVGYSQGTSAMFALLSLRPEYAQIVKPYIAWAPVAFNTYATWPITYTIAPNYRIFRTLGGQFIASQKWVATIGQLACRPLPIIEDICGNVFFALFGASNRLNESRISTYLHFLPDVISNWEMVHISMTQMKRRFCRFDYGNSNENEKAYGQADVPDYPLENISPNTTIILMRGATDIVANPKDAAHLVSVLNGTGANVVDYLVPVDKFNHADFFLGMGTGKLLNDPTLEYLDQYA